MKTDTYVVRNGYDGEKCFVHARSCFDGSIVLMTAQYLFVRGSDLFDGIYSSVSLDEGKTWSEFKPQEGLAPVIDGDIITVPCDATPMYHKKSNKILLLGHTTQYKSGGKSSANGCERHTFYSVYDPDNDSFSRMKFVDMPKEFSNFGNGCGQSVELPDGDLLIPIYGNYGGSDTYSAAVMRCSFDGVDVKFKEIGNLLELNIERGVCEPSIIFYNGEYLMTARNDECGLVAKSSDGLHYTDMQLWKWQDGSILQNYNTQQHWMTIGNELYLVYTRRDDSNNHVFRHRAPLFAAKVEGMKLVKESEFAVTCERGARLGNFGVTEFKDGKSAVTVAEWMQPKGCEQYGSDNSVYFITVE